MSDPAMQVEGTTPLPYCQALAELAYDVPPDQAIVELGVYKGRSLCWLADGAKRGRGAQVVGVDVWDLPGFEGRHLTTSDHAQRALEANGLDALLVRSTSVGAGENYRGQPVGLLYIDAAHHKQAVMDDVRAWWPHLHGDALVVFDDYESTHPGVIAAVNTMRLWFADWSFDARFAYARGPVR